MRQTIIVGVVTALFGAGGSWLMHPMTTSCPDVVKTDIGQVLLHEDHTYKDPRHMTFQEIQDNADAAERYRVQFLKDK